MSVRHCLPLAAAAVLAAAAPLHAAPPCDGEPGCRADRGGGSACRRPAVYRCELKADAEPVEKSCALVERGAICIPPITTSPFDCLRDLFRRRRGSANGCGAAGCDAAGCNGAACGRGVRRAGWLSRLTHGGGGGIRCVAELGSHDYECGTRCVYEWSAVRVDPCGRPLVAPTDDADDPGELGEDEVPPPPAPLPAFEQDPAEEELPADGQAPAVGPKEGVAGDSVS